MIPAELFDLTGRTALVTGASRGIGRAFAAALAAAGASVVATGRSRDQLDETVRQVAAEGGQIRPLALDVRDEAEIRRCLADLRADGFRPDILINNAGTIDRAPLADSRTERWRDVIETNLVAPYVLCREVAGDMAERGWGRIVNVASIMAVHGKKNAHSYTASKHGAAGLTRALAAELGPQGITVNAICPGYVRTELTSKLQGDPAFDAMVAARTPVGRWGETADLVPALLFLCSPASGYVNGHLLIVDGGLTATH